MSSPTTSTTSSTADPHVLKKLEKQLTSEAKAEDKHVKHVMKDLASTEKESAKAQKSASKADAAFHKQEQKEINALKAMNKATHQHDIAATNVVSAEKEAKLLANNEAKVHQVVEEKKVQVDAVLQKHEIQSKEREAALEQVRAGQIPEGVSTH